MITIKRYANRKLRFPKLGYTDLAEIGRIVRDGAEVRVIQHGTNEDVTAETLQQIVAYHSKLEPSRAIAIIRLSKAA